MRFGPLPVAQAEGAVLAHSVAQGGLRLRKGRVLTAADIATLTEAGVAEVSVAALGPEDVAEDIAAARVASGLAGAGISISEPFTGRVNLHATQAGLFTLDAAAVARLNAVDPAITLATLPQASWVAPRQMLATVKIIPYAAPEEAVAKAQAIAAEIAPRVTAPVTRSVALILTETPGFKPSVLKKGAKAVQDRLAALGLAPAREVVVAHESAAIAGALGGASEDLVLILTATATSDSADVAPAAVLSAGGRLERFGMPVDPGNLLFIGEVTGRPVIGLPGCARSPALNGADWVLQRVVAGHAVRSEDIAAMGVGGLLKEIPTRPQPRGAPVVVSGKPVVHALVLAAGASRRMRGRDKLLEDVGSGPLLRHVVEQAQRADVAKVFVALPAGATARAEVLAGAGAELVEVRDAHLGMSASIRAGVVAAEAGADGVVLMLGDMPEVEAAHLDRLLAGFDPSEGREIIRAVSEAGVPGHPVLFGRRFFEPLQRLEGDRGAKTVITSAAEFVTDVVLPGAVAVTDLDTPEAWAEWRAVKVRSAG